MKPILLFLGLTTWLLCAARLASAQAPDYLPNATSFVERTSSAAGAWRSPPLASLPHGYLWQDYQAPGIRHGVYAPRDQVHFRHPQPAREFLSILCTWLDTLLGTRHSPTSPVLCESPTPAEAWQPPISALELAPQTGPLPAPQPVILTPTPDLTVDDASPQPAPRGGGPGEGLKAASPVVVPDQLNPVRPPVVELAPDIVLPEAPASPSPPRNRIPVPGGAPPRNAIPR